MTDFEEFIALMIAHPELRAAALDVLRQPAPQSVALEQSESK